MKHLIKHLILNQLDKIADRSLLNCHVKGIHSIMLLESPGQTIRLYIAMPDNDLVRDPGNLAYHPHHCNLTLHCIKGKLINELVTVSDTGLAVNKYLYNSKITDGKTYFKLISEVFLKNIGNTLLTPGESINLNSRDIHTVRFPENILTAWLVYEGQEDSEYTPHSYSNKDLTTLDTTGLYQKNGLCAGGRLIKAS